MLRSARHMGVLKILLLTVNVVVALSFALEITIYVQPSYEWR